jgi:NAD(P)-dependent dehydrogenase (short-subunit alcohol dehydrogenase family)
MNVHGKTVLITGGAQGIGKGIARQCLLAGARVVFTNLDDAVGNATETELAALGSIRRVRADVTDAGASEALLDDIFRCEGRLDVIFANAGAGMMKGLLDCTPADVQSQFNLNYFGNLWLTQAYVKRLQARGGEGHIMFTGSENSLVMPPDNAELKMGIYGATKHALLVTAEWLRHELKGTGVNVSLLLPGPVLTESLKTTFDALATAGADDPLHQVIPPHAEKMLRQRFISCDECGRIALDGLAKGLFFIPTQGYIFSDVGARYREVRAAFESLKLV